MVHFIGTKVSYETMQKKFKFIFNEKFNFLSDEGEAACKN